MIRLQFMTPKTITPFIENISVLYSQEIGEPLEKVVFGAYLTRMMQQQKSYQYLIYKDKEMIGICSGYIQKEEFPTINIFLLQYLFILEEHRCSDLDETIAVHLARWCIKEGVNKIATSEANMKHSLDDFIDILAILIGWRSTKITHYTLEP